MTGNSARVERVLPVYAPPSGSIAVWSRGMMNVPLLEIFLGAKVRFRPKLPDRRHLSDVTALAGWGYKQSSQKVRKLAASRNIPYLAVEDGFLRSLDLGVRHAPPCSLVVDATGMYYDATHPSDLEILLNSTGWESPELIADAKRAMGAIRRHGLSKYNHAPDAPPFLLTTPGKRLRILILDQTVGDSSVALGMASAETFTRMLERARADHPGAALFVKTHPDVLAGKKQGYLTQLAAVYGATLLGQDASPLSLLAQADEVYTVTSQMGFEALLLNKPVHCFGLPFYAGWGLTDDARPCPRRVARRSVTEVFAAAYMLYSRYVNPVTGVPCSIHDVIRLLALQRRHNEQNSGYSACLGFDRWKHPHARAFLASTRGSIQFFRNEAHAVRKAAVHKGRVVVWASRQSPQLGQLCADHHVPLVRMEDGFLRSVGLGSDYERPLSLVRDTEGMYYNPSRPSALESTLQKLPTGVCADEEMLSRAVTLREHIVSQGLTKYNLATSAEGLPLLPPLDGGKQILLVPGQVEDDASVRLGGQGMTTNLDLLRAVRAAHSDAYIIYKPHPDVERSNRKGRIADDEALTLADVVIREVSILSLFPLIHEVHTLTSLTGFEALLRRIPVHTYGAPFYAGWGLTTDRLLFPRRTRPLTLDILVAGTLILYPSYYDWQSRLICGPEEVCDILRHGQPRPPLWVRVTRRLRDNVLKPLHLRYV